MPSLLEPRPKLIALIAGFLSATGFEPLKLWPVTLACFALLILLIESALDRKSAFTRGWLFGVGHFTLGLNWRSEEHTSELQSLMRISYAVFCLKQKTKQHITTTNQQQDHQYAHEV